MNCTEPKGKADASGRPRQAASEKLGAPLGHRKRLLEAISNLASPGQPTPSGAVPQRKGDPVLVARDEGIRPESTPETLAKLKPIMKEGTVTAGNAAQQNDAAAACLVVADHKLASLGLTPIAFLAAGRQLAATRRAWGWGLCRRFGR
jgi:hypothetical protein